MDRSPSQSNLSDRQCEPIAIVHMPGSGCYDGTPAQVFVNVSFDQLPSQCTESCDCNCDRSRTNSKTAPTGSVSAHEPPEPRILLKNPGGSNGCTTPCMVATSTQEPVLPTVSPANPSTYENMHCTCGCMPYLHEPLESATYTGPSSQQISNFLGDVTMAINLTLVFNYSSDSRSFTPVADSDGTTHAVTQPVYSSEHVCLFASPPDSRLSHQDADVSPRFCTPSRQHTPPNNSPGVQQTVQFSSGELNRDSLKCAAVKLLETQNQLTPDESVVFERDSLQSINEVDVDNAPSLGRSCFMCQSKNTTPIKVSQTNIYPADYEIKPIVNASKVVPKLANTESELDLNLVKCECQQPSAIVCEKSVRGMDIVTQTMCSADNEIKPIVNMSQGVPKLVNIESQMDTNLVKCKCQQPSAIVCKKSVKGMNTVTQKSCPADYYIIPIVNISQGIPNLDNTETKSKGTLVKYEFQQPSTMVCKNSVMGMNILTRITCPQDYEVKPIVSTSHSVAKCTNTELNSDGAVVRCKYKQPSAIVSEKPIKGIDIATRPQLIHAENTDISEVVTINKALISCSVLERSNESSTEEQFPQTEIRGESDRNLISVSESKSPALGSLDITVHNPVERDSTTTSRQYSCLSTKCKTTKKVSSLPSTRNPFGHRLIDFVYPALQCRNRNIVPPRRSKSLRGEQLRSSIKSHMIRLRNSLIGERAPGKTSNVQVTTGRKTEHSTSRLPRVFCFGIQRDLNSSTEPDSARIPTALQVTPSPSSDRFMCCRNRKSPIFIHTRVKYNVVTEKLRSNSCPSSSWGLKTIEQVERERYAKDESSNSATSTKELVPDCVDEEKNRSICMPYLCLRSSSEAHATTHHTSANASANETRRTDTSISETDVRQSGESQSRRCFIKRCPFQRKSRSLSEASLQRLPLTYKGEQPIESRSISSSHGLSADKSGKYASKTSEKELKDCVNSWGASVIEHVSAQETLTKLDQNPSHHLTKTENENIIGLDILKKASEPQCKRSLSIKTETLNSQLSGEQHIAKQLTGTMELSMCAYPETRTTTKNCFRTSETENKVNHHDGFREINFFQSFDNMDLLLQLEISLYFVPDELLVDGNIEDEGLNCIEPVWQKQPTIQHSNALPKLTSTETLKQSDGPQTATMEIKCLPNGWVNLPITNDYRAPEQNQLQLSSVEETIQIPVFGQQNGCAFPIGLFISNFHIESQIMARPPQFIEIEVEVTVPFESSCTNNAPYNGTSTQPNLLNQTRSIEEVALISTHSEPGHKYQDCRIQLQQSQPTYANESMIKQRREKAKNFNVTEVPVLDKPDSSNNGVQVVKGEQSDQVVTEDRVNRFTTQVQPTNKPCSTNSADVLATNNLARQNRCACGFDPDVVDNKSQTLLNPSMVIHSVQRSCSNPALGFDPSINGDMRAIDNTVGMFTEPVESQTPQTCSCSPHEVWKIISPHMSEMANDTVECMCDPPRNASSMPRLMTDFPGSLGRISIQFTESIIFRPTNGQQFSIPSRTENRLDCLCFYCSGSKPLPNQRSNCCVNLTASDLWSNHPAVSNLDKESRMAASPSSALTKKASQKHAKRMTARERLKDAFVVEDCQSSINDSHTAIDENRLITTQCNAMRPDRDLSRTCIISGPDESDPLVPEPNRRKTPQRWCKDKISSNCKLEQQQQLQKLTAPVGDNLTVSMSYSYTQWELVTISLIPIINYFPNISGLALTQISCIPTRGDVQLCLIVNKKPECCCRCYHTCELYQSHKSVTHSSTQTVDNYCTNQPHLQFASTLMQPSVAIDLVNELSGFTDDVSGCITNESKRSLKNQAFDINQEIPSKSYNHDQQQYNLTPFVSQIKCPDLKEPSRDSSPSTSLDIPSSSRSLPPVSQSERSSGVSSDQSTLTLCGSSDQHFKHYSPLTHYNNTERATSQLEHTLISPRLPANADDFSMQPVLTSLNQCHDNQMVHKQLVSKSKHNFNSLSPSVLNLSQRKLYNIDSDLSGRSSSLPVIPSPIGMVDYLQQFRQSQSIFEAAVAAAATTVSPYPKPTQTKYIYSESTACDMQLRTTQTSVIPGSSLNDSAERTAFSEKNTATATATTTTKKMERKSPQSPNHENRSSNPANDTLRQRLTDRWNNASECGGGIASVCPCPNCGFTSRTIQKRTARANSNMSLRKPLYQHIGKTMDHGTISYAQGIIRELPEQNTPSLKNACCHGVKTTEMKAHTNKGGVVGRATSLLSSRTIGRMDSTGQFVKNLTAQRCQCILEPATNVQLVSHTPLASPEHDSIRPCGLANNSIQRSMSQAPSFEKSGYGQNQQPTTITACCCLFRNACTRQDGCKTCTVGRRTSSIICSRLTEPMHCLIKTETDCLACKRSVCVQGGHVSNCSCLKKYRPFRFR